MSRRMYYARFHLTEEAETEEPPRRKKSEEASQQLEIRQSEVQQTEKARFRTESRPQWGDQVLSLIHISAGKGLDKSLKKQIKASSNDLRRLTAKCRLEKVTDQELEEIRQAKSHLEELSARI